MNRTLSDLSVPTQCKAHNILNHWQLFCWLKCSMYDVTLDVKLSWNNDKIRKHDKILTENLRKIISVMQRKCRRNFLLKSAGGVNLTDFSINSTPAHTGALVVYCNDALHKSTFTFPVRSSVYIMCHFWDIATLFVLGHLLPETKDVFKCLRHMHLVTVACRHCM